MRLTCVKVAQSTCRINLKQVSSNSTYLRFQHRARIGHYGCGRTVGYFSGNDFRISNLIDRVDLWLHNLIAALPGANYTVVYTTTPVAKDSEVPKEEPGSYQMDSSMSPLGHLELKRDLGTRDVVKNVTLVEGPLFERYQYFTPGKSTLSKCSNPPDTDTFQAYSWAFWSSLSSSPSFTLRSAALPAFRSPMRPLRRTLVHHNRGSNSRLLLAQVDAELVKIRAVIYMLYGDGSFTLALDLTPILRDVTVMSPYCMTMNGQWRYSFSDELLIFFMSVARRVAVR